MTLPTHGEPPPQAGPTELTGAAGATAAPRLGAFFLRTLLALAVALALWYLLRGWVVSPVGWVAEPVMQTVHGGWVHRVEQEDAMLVLLTAIRAVDASGRAGELAPEVNALTYAFGLPLLVALLVGSRASGLWWKIPFGALVLLPFQVWGVCFSWLVQVAVHAQGALGGVRFSDWQVNAYGLGYQLGFLIFPALVPVVLWVALERDFVARVGLVARR